jgi:hypothetical protein
MYKVLIIYHLIEIKMYQITVAVVGLSEELVH